jgi:hypothetical protein
MQMGRSMLLDHKPPPLRSRDLGLAAGLRGLFEIPFLSIDGEAFWSHGSIPKDNKDMLWHGNKNPEPKPSISVEVPEFI